MFNDIVIGGLLSAMMKWFIETTKMDQYRGNVIGHAIWTVSSEQLRMLRNWHCSLLF